MFIRTDRGSFSAKCETSLIVTVNRASLSHSHPLSNGNRSCKISLIRLQPRLKCVEFYFNFCTPSQGCVWIYGQLYLLLQPRPTTRRNISCWNGSLVVTVKQNVNLDDSVYFRLHTKLALTEIECFKRTIAM